MKKKSNETHTKLLKYRSKTKPKPPKIKWSSLCWEIHTRTKCFSQKWHKFGSFWRRLPKLSCRNSRDRFSAINRSWVGRQTGAAVRISDRFHSFYRVCRYEVDILLLPFDGLAV